MINSLKIKIIGLVTVTIIGIVSLVSYVTYRQQKEMLYDMATYNTNVLNETVKNSISDAMRSGRSQEISAIFSRLRSKEFISSCVSSMKRARFSFQQTRRK